MKQYTGTKTINAKPMNRLDYNIFRGWDLPTDENGEDEGYLTEDINGAANVPDYNGYVQWVTELEFNRTYSVSGTFVDRLSIEKVELVNRLGKLNDYLLTLKEDNLPLDHTSLVDQQIAMTSYLIALAERESFHTDNQ